MKDNDWIIIHSIEDLPKCEIKEGKDFATYPVLFEVLTTHGKVFIGYFSVMDYYESNTIAHCYFFSKDGGLSGHGAQDSYYTVGTHDFYGDHKKPLTESDIAAVAYRRIDIPDDVLGHCKCSPKRKSFKYLSAAKRKKKKA